MVDEIHAIDMFIYGHIFVINSLYFLAGVSITLIMGSIVIVLISKYTSYDKYRNKFYNKIYKWLK